MFHSDYYAGVVHIEGARHIWKKSDLKPRHEVTEPPAVYHTAFYVKRSTPANAMTASC